MDDKTALSTISRVVFETITELESQKEKLTLLADKSELEKLKPQIETIGRVQDNVVDLHNQLLLVKHELSDSLNSTDKTELSQRINTIVGNIESTNSRIDIILKDVADVILLADSNNTAELVAQVGELRYRLNTFIRTELPEIINSSTQTPEGQARGLETLKGKDRLDAKAIKNLPESVMQAVSVKTGLTTDKADKRYVKLGGRLRLAIRTTTAPNDNLGVNDYHLVCDASSNDIAVTLPAAADNKGVIYVITKKDETGNEVSVSSIFQLKVLSSSTWMTVTQGDSITVQSDGIDWLLI